MTREEMEKIWNGKITFQDHVVVWNEDGTAEKGELRLPSLGKSAEKVKRRLTKHYGPPPPSNDKNKLLMPKWLRENYKRNCPRNYATLVAEYGRITKLDLAILKM